MGTATETGLPGGRGDENESLLPNLEETKREKAGLCHRAGLVSPGTSVLGQERIQCLDEDFEPLCGAGLAE